MRKPIQHSPTDQSPNDASDAILRRFVGYNMKRAFNVVQQDLHQCLKPFNLRMLTFTTLAIISENQGVRQSQLAQAMDIERPNLVVLLDELEQRDLIRRERMTADRRAFVLHTTEKGQALYEKSIQAVASHEQRLMSALDETKLNSLIEALQLIREFPQSEDEI